MTTVVEPGQGDSTHDLNLISLITQVPLIMCDSKGNRNPLAFRPTPINRGSLKMYTGVAKYADLEPPWTPISQSDWSGGRGGKDFDRNETMYYDGYGVNTLRPGEVILGPKATEIAISTSETNTAGAGSQYALSGYPAAATYYTGCKFTVVNTLDVVSIEVTLRNVAGGATTGSLTVGLAEDSSGSPGSQTYSTTTLALSSLTSSDTTYSFTIAATTLTAAETWWIIFKLTSLNTSSYYRVAYRASSTITTTSERKTSSDGSTWANYATTSAVPYFTMIAAYTNAKFHFFEYKGATYAVAKKDDASSSKLYINGDQGVVKTGGDADEITFSSGVKTWALDEAVGSIMKIVSGTATSQPQPWRVITHNHASSASPGETYFQVSPAFDVAPAANDIAVIVASDEWTEVADFDTTYNINVTDVLSVNGAMYFACGDSTAMKRGVGWNSGGTWTYDFSEEAGQDAETGQFTYLGYATDQQGPYVWGAKGGFPATIAKASPWDASAYSGTETVLSFGTAIAVGDQWERITGLQTYGEYGNLHILKEGSLWQVMDDKPYKIDIQEMGNTKDDRNGRAHCVQGKYLVFSWHDTVERYYNQNLDGIGPDKAEEAFPTSDRAGHFTSLVSYPGLIFGSVDAGTSGVSSVLAYNGQGWHEMYRAALGYRIQNIFIQSIPGNTVDRLWISAGNKIVWIPLSLDPYNHPDSSYYFNLTGDLITSWYYLGLVDVYKFFNSLRLVIENTTASTQYVKAYYQIDDGDWEQISGDSDTYVFDTFSEEIDLTIIPQENGRRIRFKFSLVTTSAAETPRILASVVEAAVRVPTKYQYAITALIEDYGRTIMGAPEDKDDVTSSYLASGKYANLLTLQGLTVPVRVESTVPMLDGIYAFVDGVQPTPIKVRTAEGLVDKYAVTFSLIQV